MSYFTHSHASRLRRYLAGPRSPFTVVWSDEGLSVNVARPGGNSCRTIEVSVRESVVAVTEGERVLAHVALGYGWISKVADSISWDDNLRLWLLQQELDSAWRELDEVVVDIAGTLHTMGWFSESEAVDEFSCTLDGYGNAIGEIDSYIERALNGEPAQTAPVASSVSPSPVPPMTNWASAIVEA